MCSIRIQTEESNRNAFMRLCLDHKPRLSMNAAIDAFIKGVLSGAIPLPAGSGDKRIEKVSDKKSGK